MHVNTNVRFIFSLCITITITTTLTPQVTSNHLSSNFLDLSMISQAEKLSPAIAWMYFFCMRSNNMFWIVAYTVQFIKRNVPPNKMFRRNFPPPFWQTWICQFQQVMFSFPYDHILKLVVFLKLLFLSFIFTSLFNLFSFRYFAPYHKRKDHVSSTASKNSLDNVFAKPE